ncbi:MAG: hypothetical protein JNK72_13835 [Myxococcales bacterium]|nr:hypothetical protein [Myxococcales bacterium]
MSNWQPARIIDIVLRFENDLGPALKMALSGIRDASSPPEDRAREALRTLARGVGRATHAYVWAAPNMQLTHARLPVEIDPACTLLHVRLHMNMPMNAPIDWTNGQAVAGLLQSLMGLPRGALQMAEIGFPAVAGQGENGPLLSMMNPRTLPGQKLCEYCKNPMPAYETQCRNCGARVEG